MLRCPVCDSVRIVVVIGPRRRSFCPSCGSRWIQDGGLQRAIEATPQTQPAAGA